MKRSITTPLAVLCLSLFLAGCFEEPEATRPISYGTDLLQMVVSDRWELWSEGDDERAEQIYAHKDFFDLRLHVAGHVEDFGHPLRVRDVKSLIGRELNLAYGGVTSRVSLGGNAMISYAREDAEEVLHLEEWVLAKPVAGGGIARIEISLRMPPERRADPKLAPLIKALDQRLGDAKIPRA